MRGVLAAVLGLLSACAARTSPAPPPVPLSAGLEAHCDEVVGEPRVEEVAPGVWVALAYDLANIVLIETSDGHLVVDAGMSPGRAREAREALLAVAPGRVAHLVYTHSHIDHVGGASAWVEEGTEVWATEALEAHFFEQYGRFLPAEIRRGGRQFGRHVPESDLPCSSIGRRVDLEAALENGVVLPTRTFSGATTLTHGGRTLQLVEAHGETHDQLYVWLPEEAVLLPGDNWYAAFPNLYTIRGTAPRDVDAWIASLDAMRSEDPAVLVPAHTPPVRGVEEVREALTATRDAIQWVRDETVRGANAGRSLDELAEDIALPPHLAGLPALQPRYGQLDWSVRALYANELGWFDGEARHLYPLEGRELAARSVALMGGPEAVSSAVDAALAEGEAAWALHLLHLLRAAGEGGPGDAEREARALELQAAAVENTNGRAYLLERARELRGETRPLGDPVLSQGFIDGLPLEQLVEIMASRLRTAESMDVHESVRIEFSDHEAPLTLTVRRGVLELRWGAPLPGTPEPVAVARTDSRTWKELSLGLRTSLGAIASRDLAVEGDVLAFRRFFGRLDAGVDPGG